MLGSLGRSGLDDVVKEAGYGEGANAAEHGGDSGEVCAVVELGGEVASNEPFFAGGASVD